MERLEVIVQADELKPKDVVRRGLNAPAGDLRTIVSVTVRSDRVKVEFEVGAKKVRWSVDFRQSERFVLIHRPRPEGKSELEMHDDVDRTIQHAMLGGRHRPLSLKPSLSAIHKATEAYMLSMPLESQE